MPATYRSASSVNVSSASANIVVTAPAGAAAGDWIAVAISQGAQIDTFSTVPTGFAAEGTSPIESTDGKGSAFIGKFSDVGAGPWTFIMSASRLRYGFAVAVQGADLTTQPDVATTVRTSAGASTSFASTSQTTVTAGCCIVAFFGCSPNAARTYTATTGTERVEGDNGDAGGVAITDDQVSAGAIALAGTISVSEAVWGIQMAFRPVSGPPPPVPNLLTVRSGLSWG